MYPVSWCFQETDDKLVNSLIPVCIGTISFIAKIGIEGFFPHSFEGPVKHFGKLGVAFYFCSFLLHIGLQELRICESDEGFNTVGPIIGYHFGSYLAGVFETLLTYGGF